MARPTPPPHKPGRLAPPPGPAPVSKADKELLFKGVLCALLGAIILLAPYLARSGSVQELMAGASAVGWFALLLGCAFIGLFARHRLAAATRRWRSP